MERSVEMTDGVFRFAIYASLSSPHIDRRFAGCNEYPVGLGNCRSVVVTTTNNAINEFMADVEDIKAIVCH